MKALQETALWRITRGRRRLWYLGIVSLALAWAGAPNSMRALPLGAYGNHAGENHAGENHAGEDLEGINLTNANLAATDFSGASLLGADFTNADLSGTNFSNANLDNSSFNGAVLTPETTFRGASISGAELSNLDLRGTDIGRAAYLDYTGFWNSNLSGLTLTGFTGLTFDFAVVSNADLRFSEIRSGQDAHFTGADFRYAWADGAHFANADFTNADLRFFRIDEGYFTNANFTNADLRFAYFNGDFTGAIFTGAKIYGTTFDTAVGVYGLDLTGAISKPYATPEPSTWVLLCTGLIGLLGYGWRRQRCPTP